MSIVQPSDVKKLREETGAGVMECKKALEEAQGDYARAVQIVKERGLAKAAKKQDRETKQGYIASYVHSNGQVAAMVEILCETDFVARNEEFQKLAQSIAMHVTAMNPASVDELLTQEFIRGSETVDTMVKALSGKIGKKFVVNRIVRLEVGQS